MKFSAIICLAFIATVASVARAESEEEVSETVVYRPELHHLWGNTKVVNGADAQPNAYPYQVSLWWGFTALSASHSCGGSILSASWVVTAAHCFTELPSFGTHIVYAGKHNLRTTESTEQSSRISQRFIHPSYTGGVGPHDIALIKLATPFRLNSAVAAISLPAQNTVHTGNAILSGWGSTSLTAWPSMPNILQFVSVPVLDTATCHNAFTNFVSDPPLDPTTLDNVCSGPLDESRISACSGDSGGPLATQASGNWELVGIVSWGLTPCGTIGAPSVYVRASAYVSWIEGIIAANS